MILIMAQRQFKEAPKKGVTLAEDWVLKVGEDVLVYSEPKKVWLGLLKSVHADSRTETVKT